MIVIGLQEYRPSVIVVGPVAVQSWLAEGMPSLFNRILVDSSGMLILRRACVSRERHTVTTSLAELDWTVSGGKD